MRRNSALNNQTRFTVLERARGQGFIATTSVNPTGSKVHPIGDNHRRGFNHLSPSKRAKSESVV